MTWLTLVRSQIYNVDHTFCKISFFNILSEKAQSKNNVKFCKITVFTEYIKNMFTPLFCLNKNQIPSLIKVTNPCFSVYPKRTFLIDTQFHPGSVQNGSNKEVKLLIRS